MAERIRKSAAKTPESREKKLISMAVELAEQKLADGTASTQLIAMLLRLSTSQSKLEIERLEKENELLLAKIDKLRTESQSSEMYKQTIDAIRSYRGEEVIYEEG